MSTSIQVPSLEVMREMSDADLLRLRTDLSFDMARIENQLRFEGDPGADLRVDWERRAQAAQHIRQYGVNAVKNILAERRTARNEHPAVPLRRWMEINNVVIEAARRLLSAIEPGWEGRSRDEDLFLAQLESALVRLDAFNVEIGLLYEVVGS